MQQKKHKQQPLVLKAKVQSNLSTKLLY